MDRRCKAPPLAAVILIALVGSSAGLAAEPAQNQDPAAGSNIFGAQALPKGLTIVPWKKGSVADLTAGPTRLVEEPLEPIDPDEFRRRLEYYQRAQGQ